MDNNREKRKQYWNRRSRMIQRMRQQDRNRALARGRGRGQAQFQDMARTLRRGLRRIPSPRTRSSEPRMGGPGPSFAAPSRSPRRSPRESDFPDWPTGSPQQFPFRVPTTGTPTTQQWPPSFISTPSGGPHWPSPVSGSSASPQGLRTPHLSDSFSQLHIPSATPPPPSSAPGSPQIGDFSPPGWKTCAMCLEYYPENEECRPCRCEGGNPVIPTHYRCLVSFIKIRDDEKCRTCGQRMSDPRIERVEEDVGDIVPHYLIRCQDPDDPNKTIELDLLEMYSRQYYEVEGGSIPIPESQQDHIDERLIQLHEEYRRKLPGLGQEDIAGRRALGLSPIQKRFNPMKWGHQELQELRDQFELRRQDYPNPLHLLNELGLTYRWQMALLGGNLNTNVNQEEQAEQVLEALNEQWRIRRLYQFKINEAQQRMADAKGQMPSKTDPKHIRNLEKMIAENVRIIRRNQERLSRRMGTGTDFGIIAYDPQDSASSVEELRNLPTPDSDYEPLSRLGVAQRARGSVSSFEGAGPSSAQGAVGGIPSPRDLEGLSTRLFEEETEEPAKETPVFETPIFETPIRRRRPPDSDDEDGDGGGGGGGGRPSRFAGVRRTTLFD